MQLILLSPWWQKVVWSGTQAAPSAAAAGFFALLSPFFVLPCEKGVNRSLVSVFRLLEDPNAIISKRR